MIYAAERQVIDRLVVLLIAAEQFIAPVDRYTLASRALPEDGVFSDSDQQALAWAWQHFGDKTGFVLADLTHFYPEWQRHEKALESKMVSRAPMSYRDFLEDPAPGVEPCHPLTAEEREAVAAGIDERAQFERLWP